MNKNFFAPGAIYNDNHKEITINGASNAAELVRAFMADEAEDVESVSAPAASTEAEVWKKPKKGKYSEVRRYIEERKRGDVEFREYCAKHSLRELCTRLTEEFGWFVDEHSLGANLNRHI